MSAVPTFFDSTTTPAQCDAVNEGFEAAFNGADELLDNPYLAADGEDADLAGFWLDGYQDFHRQEREIALQDHRRKQRESTDAVLQRLRAVSMQELGERIGVPVSTWHGRCFEIASLLVKAFAWEDAEAVYGLYLGPIARGCKTFEPCRSGATRHGWIVTREGVLVDPTAWVFQASEPALRVLLPGTEEDFNVREHYDEGAESLSGVYSQLFPDASSCANQEVVAVPDRELLQALLEHATRIHRVDQALQAMQRAPALRAQVEQAGGFVREQLSWLAKRPYSSLGTKTARGLYQLLIERNLSSLIPVDFLRRMRREERWGQAC